MTKLFLLSLLLLLADHCQGQRTLVSLRNKLKTLDSRKKKESDFAKQQGKERDQQQRWIYAGVTTFVALLIPQIARRGECAVNPKRSRSTMTFFTSLIREELTSASSSIN